MTSILRPPASVATSNRAYQLSASHFSIRMLRSIMDAKAGVAGLDTRAKTSRRQITIDPSDP